MDETAMEILRDAKHAPSLKHALFKLYEEKTLCDVTLTSSDGVELQAHWLVLSAHSDFLRHLAVSRSVMQFMMTESGSLKLNIDTSTLKTILDYLYSGDLVVTKETLSKIKQAAKVLQLSRVLVLLEQSHLSCLGDQSHEAESRILQPLTVQPVAKYFQPVTAAADNGGQSVHQSVSCSNEQTSGASQPQILAVTSLSSVQTSWADRSVNMDQQHTFHEFNRNSALNKQFEERVDDPRKKDQPQEIQTQLKNAPTDFRQTLNIPSTQGDTHVDFDDKRDCIRSPTSPTLYSDNEFEQQIVLDSLTVSRKRGRPGGSIVFSPSDVTSKKGRPQIYSPEAGRRKSAPLLVNAARSSSLHFANVVSGVESSMTTQHSDLVTTQHRDQITTQRSDPVATHQSDSVTTQHSDPVTTQHSDSVTTQHNDPVTNQHSDPVTTQHSDLVTDQHSDLVTTQHSDLVTTQHSDLVTDQHSDPVTTQHSDPVTTQHSDQVTPRHGELVASQHGEPVTTQCSESVASQHGKPVTTQHCEPVTTEHSESESTASEKRTLSLQHQEQRPWSSGRVQTCSPGIDLAVVKVEAFDDYEDCDYSVFENTGNSEGEDDNEETGNGLPELSENTPKNQREGVSHPQRNMKRKRDEDIPSSDKTTSTHRLPKTWIQCDHCELNFKTYINLKKHCANKHSLGGIGMSPGMLQSCVADRNEALQQTSKTPRTDVRNEDPPASTSYCDTSIPVSDVAKRRCSDTHPTVHMCDFCGKEFSTISSLLHHTRIHHRMELMDSGLGKIRFGTTVINETPQNDQLLLDRSDSTSSVNNGTNPPNDAEKGDNPFGSEEGQSLHSMQADELSWPTYTQKPTAFGQTGRNGIKKRKKRRKRFRFNTGKRDSFRKEGFFIPSRPRPTAIVHHENPQTGQVPQNDQLLADDSHTTNYGNNTPKDLSEASHSITTGDLSGSTYTQKPNALSQTGTKGFNKMKSRRRNLKFFVAKRSTSGHKHRRTARHQGLLQSNNRLGDEVAASSRSLLIHECLQCGSILSCTSALNRHIRTIHKKDKITSGFSDKKTIHHKDKITSGFRFVSRDAFGLKSLPTKTLQGSHDSQNDVSSVDANLDLSGLQEDNAFGTKGDNSFGNMKDNSFNEEMEKSKSHFSYACHLCGNKYKYNFCLNRHMKMNHGKKVIAKKSKIFGKHLTVIPKGKRVFVSKAKGKDKKTRKNVDHIPVSKNIPKQKKVSVSKAEVKDHEDACKKADDVKSRMEVADNMTSDVRDDLETEHTTTDSLNLGEYATDKSGCSSNKARDGIKTPNRLSASPADLTCSICKRQYSRIDTVYAHYRAVHMKVSKYVCPCKREFRWSSNFSNHKKVCPIFQQQLKE